MSSTTSAAQTRRIAAAGYLRFAISAAAWIVPPLLMYWVFRPSLRAWFQQDDFAWLGMAAGIASWKDLLEALFLPTVHGTLRPFSERGYFILFRAIFGLDILPWRIWAFATQAGSLVLLNAITRKLTGSSAAGFLAAALWAVHSRMATALSWTSAYMQVLCGFCLLLAFFLWLRHVETGKIRYQAWMWIVFLLGFGVMESNLVFPALAATHAFFFARRHLPKAMALFVPSLAYLALHMWFVPKQSSGLYSIHIGPAMLGSLWRYWRWTVSPVTVAGNAALPEPWPTVLLVLGTLLLAGFVVWSLWRRQWLAPLFALWYLILLGPVLPLTEHLVDYYVSLSLIGFSMLAAWALVQAFRSAGARPGWRWVFPAASVVTLALFVAISVPAARMASRWFRGRGEQTEKVVRGTLRARELHPTSAILLDGVEFDLYSSVICDGAFTAFGVTDVLLTPGSGAHMPRRPDLCEPGPYTAPYEVAANAIDRGSAQVYSVRGPRLKNITNSYSPPPTAEGRKSLRLDVASHATTGFLGPEWPEPNWGLRWMPVRATVRLPALPGSGRKLVLTARYHRPSDRMEPLPLQLSIEGRRLPEASLRRPGEVRLEFALADDLPQRGALNLVLELGPEAEAGETRLAFGALEIQAP